MSLQINPFSALQNALSDLPGVLGNAADGIAAQAAALVQDGTVDGTTSAEAQATEQFQQQFGDLAQDKDAFHAMMKQVYGENYDAAKAEEYRQMALKGDYSFLPPVQFVSRETLNGGNGAYNEAEGVIYLAEDLKNDPAKMQSVFVEEAGHHLDAMLNTGDSMGDEGELFRRLMSGEKLSNTEIAAIRAENDKGVIMVDGKAVEVEFWFGEDIVDAVGDAVSDAVDYVGNAVGGAVDAVGDAIGEVVDGIVDAVGMVAEGLFEGITGFFGNLVQLQFGDAFQSLIDGADKAFLQAPKRLVNAGINAFERVIQAPTYFLPEPVGGAVRDFQARGVDSFRSVANAGMDITRNSIRTFVEMPVNFGEDLWDAGVKLANGDFGGALAGLGWAVAHPFVSVANMVVDDVMIGAQAAVNVVGNMLYLHEPSRPLTDDEKAYLREVYGDSIDVDSIRVHEDNLSTQLGIAPHTLGNDIYIPKTNSDGSIVYIDGNGELTDQGKLLLAHEAFHTWQSQNGGDDYIGKSLWAQLTAAIEGGNRNGAYDWTESAPGTPFSELNPEQQASLLETIATARLYYDTNGDGEIQKNELEMALNDRDQDGNQDFVDDDGDGVNDLTPVTLTDEQFEYAMAAWDSIQAGQGAP